MKEKEVPKERKETIEKDIERFKDWLKDLKKQSKEIREKIIDDVDNSKSNFYINTNVLALIVKDLSKFKEESETLFKILHSRVNVKFFTKNHENKSLLTEKYIQSCIDRWKFEPDNGSMDFENYAIKYPNIQITSELKEIDSRKVEFYDETGNVTNKVIRAMDKMDDTETGNKFYDRIRNILHLIIIHLQEYPHKKMIFLYSNFEFQKHKEIKHTAEIKEKKIVPHPKMDWDTFCKEKLSLNFLEIYAEIIKMELSDNFRIYFEDYCKEITLKKVGTVYEGYRDTEDTFYMDFLTRIGEQNKLLGLIKLWTFFNSYYNPYPKIDETNLRRLIDLLSQWNNRFRKRAKLVLERAEIGMELKNPWIDP